MIKVLISVFFMFFSNYTFAIISQNLVDFVNNYQAGRSHPLFKDKQGKLMDNLDGVNLLIDQATKEINAGSTDPRVYWVRPVLKRTLLRMYRSYHKEQFKLLYGTNNNYGPEYIKLLNQEENDYEKALILNKTAPDEIKLNEEMIGKIYISRELPARILEMANRERLSILQKGVIENERQFYQDFYTEMISDYVREHDYDNALRILKEYNGIRPGMLDKYLPLLDAKRAKWQEAEIINAEAKKQEKTTEPKKPAPKVSMPQQQPVIRSKDGNQKDEPRQESNNNMMFAIGVVLAILLLVGFMAVKRIKK